MIVFANLNSNNLQLREKIRKARQVLLCQNFFYVITLHRKGMLLIISVKQTRLNMKIKVFQINDY